MAEWKTSVGMEVHAELLTYSKMFCRCPVAFGGEPNTRVCPVCVGLPGALPVPNRVAIELVLRTALALNCQIAMNSIFHRKNYFYPDLPKGYQISQYGETNPIGYAGHLDIPTPAGDFKRIHIRRVHLEEDTGKLMHLPGGGSGIDFNRAGVPLMEIVTEFPPDIESAEEAKEYLSQLRSLLIWIGASDGKMEEGSMRCEPNVSIRKPGQNFGVKTELKNLNSFRAVQLGIDYEVRRQAEALESGQTLRQETRGWNEQTETTFVMRVKEEENDYRYFPDPDLAPMAFDEAMIERLRQEIPELPLAKWSRYQRDFGLNSKHADQLVSSREWAEFFEEGVGLGGNPRTICNWMIGDLASSLNESGLTARQSNITPKHLAELARLIEEGTISGRIAKDVFAEAFESGEMPRRIVEAKGLRQVSSAGEIEAAAGRVVRENPGVVARYKSGQVAVKGFLVGLAMKEGQGKFNPTMVQDAVQRALDRAET